MLVILLLLVLLLLGAWFWQDNMKAKEIALKEARRYCESKNLQLLDGTVVLKKWRVAFRGKPRLYRTFQLTAYDRAADKRRYVPIYMVGLSVIQPDEYVINLSDYR